jgi:hypothetical protein
LLRDVSQQGLQHFSAAPSPAALVQIALHFQWLAAK